MSIYLSTHILSLSPLFPSNSGSGSPSVYLFIFIRIYLYRSIFHNFYLPINLSLYRTVQSRVLNLGEGCSLERRLKLLARIVRAAVPNFVLCGPIKHTDYSNIVRGNTSLTVQITGTVPYRTVPHVTARYSTEEACGVHKSHGGTVYSYNIVFRCTMIQTLLIYCYTLNMFPLR